MSEVDVGELTVALERMGWSEVGRFRERVAYWAPLPSSDSGSRLSRDRLMIPLVSSAPDFDSLLSSAVASLRTEFGRAFDQQLETVHLMLTRQLDEIAVKRETPTASGMIDWSGGDVMVSAVRGMLSAGAKASNARQMRFLTSQSTISKEFLAGCYMGQTRVGSYVVTALAPANRDFATSLAKNTKAPSLSGRLITQRLAASLGAVRAALDETDGTSRDHEVFEDYVKDGVSFELLKALEPLVAGGESAVEIEFNSLDTQIPLEGVAREADRVEVVFSAKDADKITRARMAFETAPPPSTARITGEVVSLHSSHASDDQRITVAALIDKAFRSITINLNRDQYLEAVRAHGESRFFTVKGDLEVRSRGRFIEVADEVQVEDLLLSAAPPDGLPSELWSGEEVDVDYRASGHE